MRICAVLLSTALAGALTLSGCGSDSPGENRSAVNASDQAWSYTSANGDVVQVDHLPVRIIAHSDEAAALMSYGIKPVGIYGNEKPEDNRNLASYDLSGIEVLGTEWGAVDVEKAAALRPDLIVADWWPAEKAYSGFEKGVQAKSKKLADLAPVIGGEQGDSIVTMLDYYQRLAAELGADIDSSDGARDEAAFDAALKKFKAAAAAKPGLTTMGMSPADDLLYIANPTYAPELLDFRRWGLTVMNPRDPDPAFPYWENLSWERADKYQPDLILQDDRLLGQDTAIVAKQPTWQTIAAAKAGAIVPWPAFWIHTYRSYAAELDTLADEISKARTDIGS